MITIFKNGIGTWRVSKYTFTDPQMGIRSINLTVKHPSDWIREAEAPEVADFSGSYVEYNDEKFNISSSKPAAEKGISSIDYTYTLIFRGAEEDLTRRKVRNLVSVSADDYVSQGTVFSITANIYQFSMLIESNLKHYFGGKWEVNLEAASVDSVQVDVNNLFLFDLLSKTYELYGVRWSIKKALDIKTGEDKHVINIGGAPEFIDHIFDYGSQGGLVKITRSSPDSSIVNRLSGMGGTRNVPMNYFTGRYSNFTPDPNPINDTVYIRNIMPKVFRDAVKSGTPPYVDYVEDLASIAEHGIREDSLAANEDIYPSIAGVEVSGQGRIDELVDAEVPTISDPDSEEYEPTFDIWVKDIGFNLADNQYTSIEDAKISFTTGGLAGREFVILAVDKEVNGAIERVREVLVDNTKTYNGVTSSYRITLIKSDEELAASGMMLPNSAYSASAGDKFVILNIEMPHSYVLRAEERVQNWLEDKLSELSKEKPSYTIEPMDAFFEMAEVELDGRTIASKLKSGNKLIVNNSKVTNGELELYINNLSISYGESYLPKYTITVTDKVQVGGGAVSRMQSQIDSIIDRQLFTQAEIDEMLTGSSKRYISKVKPDGSNYMLRLRGGAEFGSFASGMFTGKGGRVDDMGNAEFESIMARSFLEVPEIRYNRLTLVGEEIAVGAGGIIEKISQPTDPETGLPIDSDLYDIWLKLEEGEMNPFRPLDIVKGIYNQIGSFRTSWFHINSISGNKMSITVAADTSVPAGMNFPPKQFMNIAKVGNFIDEERQASIFLSAKDGNIHMLDGVDNYGGGFKSFQLGKLDGLENIIDFDKHTSLDKSHGYLYARGILVEDIIEVDYLGAPKRKLRDRGMWSLDTARTEPYRFTDTLQDEAWMPNGKYRCLTDGTLEMPSIGSPDWVRVVEIKHEEYSRKSTTFFAKPLVYNVGDTWFLTRDEIVHNIFYRKGTMLHAAYNTGAESDWRQVIYEPDSSSPVNLLRNHDLRFPDFQHWGGVGQSAEIQISALPTEFYKTGFNIISDEWGFNYPVIDENGNEIEL